MKNLKLIVLMLLVSNFTFSQSTTTTGVDAGQAGNNSSYFGYQAGMSSAAYNCTYIGANAGKNTTINSSANTAVGYSALENPSGTFCTGNTALGTQAGQNHNSGKDNVFLGAYSGGTGGSDNTFIGASSGRSSNSGASANVGLGRNAFPQLVGGDRNIAIGEGAGNSIKEGTGNVFIGRKSGKGVDSVNYQLHVGYDSFGTLIYGDFLTRQVGIGTNYVPTDPETDIPYILAVNGKAIAEEVRVMTPDTWPDYVFAEDYELMPLADLETEIETLGHLPGVPSAEEVETNGHDIGRMDAILLEKIEELTLHLIDLNKEVKEVRQENTALKNEIETLKK